MLLTDPAICGVQNLGERLGLGDQGRTGAGHAVYHRQKALYIGALQLLVQTGQSLGELFFAPAKISFSSFPSSAAFSVAIALFTSVRPSARG